MDIKAVLFDMDGTLIDAREWHYEALNSALAIFGFEINAEDHVKEFDGLTTKKKLNILSERSNFPLELHDIVSSIKQDRTLRIAAEKCYPISAIQILLNRLSMLGIKLCVVTNSIAETTQYMLRYSGIMHYFSIVITSADVGRAKPNPDCYLEALGRLKLEKHEVLVIEDGEYGIEAAKRAGINNIVRVTSPLDLNLELLSVYIPNLVENEI